MAGVEKFLALDVGEKRIGVAVADSQVRIAVPEVTIEVDGSEVEAIKRLIRINGSSTVVVGYPRSQSGKKSAQTDFVEEFVERMNFQDELKIVFQDESLTSVLAEERLKSSGKNYQKSDIDKEAAAIILTDYLETAWSKNESRT